MKIEIIREALDDMRVILMGAHWLGEDSGIVFWWNDVVDHKDWFTDIHTPTPEELNRNANHK